MVEDIYRSRSANKRLFTDPGSVNKRLFTDPGSVNKRLFTDPS